MAKQIGIDFGTSFIRIFLPPDGVVLRAPSVVAVDRRTREVVAIGGDAKRMFGKTPTGILAINPVREGIVADFDATARILESYFRQLKVLSTFSRPKAIISIPVNATEVGQMAAENAVLEAGARAVAVVESPLAAAVGAGLRVSAPVGGMVVDIGGGSTELAIVSSGGIVTCNVCKASGNKLDAAILHYMRQHKNINIGEMTAEYISRGLAAALPDIDRGSMTVSGISTKTGLASTVTITSQEVFNITKGLYASIARYIVSTVEDAQPDIASDIYDYGIMLTGGGSQIPGIKEYLQKSTGLRVTVAAKPLDATILGLGKIMANPEIVSDGLEYRTR